MFSLPAYDVVIWHRVQSESADLHEHIIDRAGRPPDEGIEMHGVRDMHWGFETAQEATGFAESLLELAASDDVLVLSVVASQDVSFRRKVFKDSRAILSSPK